MAKKTETQEVIEKIYEYTLEEIMGDRFGRYSKYIIQDRAIPDVRDGLKPVQRRILYGMYRGHHTYDKPYVKSARSVGDIMGKYHPHGDSSIYDAMVRMSQWWKQSTPYIDMHGNNGSMDGDSPAAMRYTEARLSKISNELLEDIDKETIVWAPNFDDSEIEPTVLPARFPNLIVNGATGISAGYATNIPPHNLGEIIDATIKRIDSPNCYLDTIMEIVKGPDFPTGGIVEGISGIRSAYETGRGKIIIKAKTSFEEEKGKAILAISEIPFEVNKALLVRKIDEIRIDKKIDGILEVRDESDKDGLRIAVDIKKDANRELILNYLLKNTDLQVSYNFNMIVIDHRRPRQLGLLAILDSYIEFKKEVIIKRTNYDLSMAKARLHIVEGLIKCLSILDEVIRVIRASKNKVDAKENLVKEFDFTKEQAEAIVMLQLYKLTNTDVTELEKELASLTVTVTGLEEILASEDKLKIVMKEELRRVKKEYAVNRKTEIKDEITEIKIDTTVMIPKEDVLVMVTKDGYIKRTSWRSYQASQEEATLKDNDYILGLYELNTLDTLLLFTNLGNYLYVPVHTIYDMKWKEMGKHISNLIKLEENEEVISVIPVTDFNTNKDITIATKNGMIKRSLMKDFQVSRYSKPIQCMKLKDDDKVIDAYVNYHDDIFVATSGNYGLWFDKSEIPVVGIKASGVKAIKLKDDVVVSSFNFNPDNQELFLLVTDKGTGKRVKIQEFEKSARAHRGLLLLREVKTNPYHTVKVFITTSKEHIGIKTPDINLLKASEFPIMDRYSTGSTISKHTIYDSYKVAELLTKDNLESNSTNGNDDTNIDSSDSSISISDSTNIESSIQEISDASDITEKILMDTKEEVVKEEKKEKPKKETSKVSLQEIDDRLMTIDDFLGDF
jgi:topoisomerase-4 subunit A